MPITTEDYVSVSDLLGSYCWRVDEGNADEWLKLWTEDGTFAGGTPEPLVGHEQLKMVVAMSNQSNGNLRHMVGNLHCSYGDTPDTILARFYNLVTDWTGGGSFKVFATCNATIVRSGDGWKVKRNDTNLLAG
jgi:SnoaL-like domain